MIYDKRAATCLLGCLFKSPELLSNTDTYIIFPEDFIDRLHKIIFSAIFNMYHDGVTVLDISEVNNYLQKYPELYSFFTAQKGNDFIMTAVEIGELENINYYYNRIKKLSLLRFIKDEGFSIEKWYAEDLYDINERQVLEKKLDDTTLAEILSDYQNRLFEIEGKFINRKNFKFSSAADGIDELLERLETIPEIGLALEGKIFTTITRGARKAKVFCLSGATGVGKSRMAVGNACKLAYPLQWSLSKEEWVNNGSNQKIIFITTELEFDEIQTIILANLSGINEEKILNGTCNLKEKNRLNHTKKIMNKFANNFYIYHMPDPNIAQLNNNVRRLSIANQVDAVFFDYIHTSPQLLNEFQGIRIREDVALMLVSTALKNLANELGIFIWTGTQLNAEGEKAEFCTEGSIRGSRAVADKLDMGAVLRPATSEFLKTIKPILQNTSYRPNMFIDIYKNRRSKYKRVRLWVDADLGTARITDLFLTDEAGNELPIDLLYAFDSTAKCDIQEIIDEVIEKPKRELKITV